MSHDIHDDDALSAELASLRQDVPPSRDLWPAIDAELDRGASRPWMWPVVLGGGALVAVAAVAVIAVGTIGFLAFFDPPGAFGPDEPIHLVAMDRLPTDGPLAAGYDALQRDQLPQAHAAFETVLKAHPEDPEAMIACSYTRMLTGDLEGADALLRDAEAEVPDEYQSGIKLRRALVALRGNDLDAVRRHGQASGLPAGLVLAAEVYLADAEADSAIPLLRKAAASRDEHVAAAASEYLDFLEDGETGRGQLAEATALWALGQRPDAVETAEQLLVFLPPDIPERDALLLLWAGRAAASRQPAIAQNLLDELGGPPPGQTWRVQATRALIAVGQGELDQALLILDLLEEGGAPADGLRDARLTAALIAQDPGDKRTLLATVEGAPAAYILGDPSRVGYDDGPLSRFVQGL